MQEDKTLAYCVKTICNEIGQTPTQLAASLGISYSTLFRIISGESSGSESLINDLIVRRPPNCSISESDLRRAFVQAKSKRKSSKTDSTEYGAINIEPLLIKIINDTLVAKKFTVQPSNQSYGFMKPDYLISTDALVLGSNEHKMWLFDFKATRKSDNPKRVAVDAVKSLLQTIGTLHLFNGPKPDKTSLVVTENSVYEEVLDLTERIMKSEDFISIIYINPEEQKVVSELFVDQPKNRTLQYYSPFAVPVEGEDNDDWPIIDF